MVLPQDKDKIENLKRGLYSRNSGNITNRNFPKMERPEYAVESDWNDKPVPYSPSRGVFIKWFLLGSFAFFLLALMFAGFMFWRGNNTVSGNNINISVLGPVSVSGGDTVTLDVAIANGNSIPLESSVLGIEFPSGARSVDDASQELVRTREDVGLVPAGGTLKRTIKAVLYGEKDTTKDIKIIFEYRVKGSNAVFSKEKIYTVAIISSPIVMEVTYPNEVGTGDIFVLTLNISSNSSVPIKNLLVTADYPFGFTYKKGTPDADFSKNTWLIKELASGSKKVIKIEGSLEAQDNEERTFRLHAGTASDKDPKVIGIDFTNFLASVAVTKPLLGVDLMIGGSRGDTFVTGASTKVSGSVSWSNNLTTKIVSPKIEIKLSGNAFDKSSVRVQDGGFYRSQDNTIIWDKTTGSGFAEFAPGDRGEVAFEFVTSALAPGRTTSRNQEIVADVSVTGTRLDDNSSGQTVTMKTNKKIKIATDVAVSGKSLYSIGGFKNTGPIPPQAERETTFTVVLQATNSLNNISNASLRATLPNYVRWLGKISPTDEDVQYDENTRTILWNIGNIGAGSGFTSGAKQLAFQIALAPSLSQVGSAPVLVSGISIAGTDAGTGLNVNVTAPNVTTLFISDPIYGDGLDKVVQ